MNRLLLDLLLAALPTSLTFGSLIIPLWFYVVCLLALGGIFGSFLNVVVYRLPRGKSLVWPGSSCPNCGATIRWHDNLPIVGWLLLKGRCRDCRARISPRYPLVEATVSAGFVLIGISHLQIAAAAGADQSLVQPSIAVLVLHASLFLVLLAAALIRFDKAPLPAKLVVVPALVFLAIASGWPEVLFPNEPTIRNIAAAVLLACLLWPACSPDAPRERLKSCGLLMCVALCLSWVAVGPIAAACAWLQFGSQVARKPRLTWPVWLPLGTLTWLAVVPRLFKAQSAGITWILIPAAAAAAATLIIRLHKSRQT